MTITITNPTVTIKAQGVTREIDASTFHPDAVEAIFTYGLRRWFQDNVNSKAAAHRNADETFDAEQLVSDRMEQAISGEITSRGESTETFTPLENAVYDVATKARKAKGWTELAAAWDASKGLTTPERKRAILDAVESLDKKRHKALTDRAQSMLDVFDGLEIDA